jgi:hypothetical protein
MAALRSRSRRTRRLWLTGVTLTALALFAVVFVAASSANLTGSNFEGNDGNLVVNSAGNHDWDNAPNLSVGVDLPKGNDDNSFGNGSKEDETAVTVGGGSIPNSKANLARFGVAGETVGSNTFLYLAWSREDQSGTVNFDFEINAAEQPNLVTFGAKTLNRTVNDLLINYSFAGGSNTPTLTFRKWSGTAWGGATPISSSCSEGATNSAAVSDTLGVPPAVAVSRPAQQFGEAAINLVCAGIIQPNTCAPFSSAYVKSRSSTAFTSEIKDFIAPVHLNLQGCGSIKIIKHTNPRGLDQSFGYTTSGAGLSDFSLNDKDGATGDSANNTKLFSALQPGTRTITENADPSGFAFNSVSCTGGGADTTTSGRVATIGLQAGEDVVCTYVNDQQLGAIKISKASIKPNTPLAGATFSITGPGSYSNSVTTAGADGSICVSGLVFGDYSVTETAAPSGYAIDDSTTHTVTVDNNTDCSGTPETFSATDTPLTNIAASAHSQAVGGTQSTVTCLDSSNANVGNSPQGLSESPSVTATGLAPGTYVCTIVIDP